MPATSGVTLDAKLRAFVQQGVSMLCASRTADNVPCVSRATGCRVLGDDRLVIFLPASRSAKLLEAIRASRHIAVVFSEPYSHKTVQLKGVDADVACFDRDDQARLATYCTAFNNQLTELGYSDAMARTLVEVDAADVTSVVFTPTSVFDQTPGPRAGEPLAVTQ